MDADVVVVGAGAAGILASWRAASLGAKVLLVEKTKRVGTKILVSGGGKCNITQCGEVEDVLKAFRPNEARFLRPSVYRFRNDDVLSLLTERGLRVYTRPDGRIFPVDQTAKDVVAIFQGYLEEAGVQVLYERPAVGLVTENGRVRGVKVGRAESRAQAIAPTGAYQAKTAKNLLRELETTAVLPNEAHEELTADRVIVCTGGSSYPNSGTTGDGWPWLRELGHTIVPLRAALAPLYLDQPLELAGVSLRDVVLKVRQGKEIARWQGDVLFTHQGLSGPCALAISRIVAEKLPGGAVEVQIDIRPDVSPEAVAEDLLRWSQTHPHRKLATYLEDLPERVADEVLRQAGIPPDQTGARLEKKARNRLAEFLKGWPVGRVRHVPLEKGEVVAGGVSLDEVDPQTMRSKIVEGLWLCGEVLDVAGPVGGYNLQAAFSTGFVAGEDAAQAHTRP